MAELCTNFAACSGYQKSRKDKLDACYGCDADIRSHSLLTAVTDKYIDFLVGRVDHNSAETVIEYDLRAACQNFAAEAKEILGRSVTLPEAAFTLQLRSLQTIADLKDAIFRGTG